MQETTLVLEKMSTKVFRVKENDVSNLLSKASKIYGEIRQM